MPAFAPTHADLAAALIWASRAAAVQRFLAPATEQRLAGVISTPKAAMSRADLFPELLRARCHGDGPGVRRAFAALIRSLGVNAQRAHPRRAERTGRARLGLKPIFARTDNTELMYLTKNNFIFFSEILEHVFHVVNQMCPAFISI